MNVRHRLHRLERQHKPKRAMRGLAFVAINAEWDKTRQRAAIAKAQRAAGQAATLIIEEVAADIYNEYFAESEA